MISTEKESFEKISEKLHRWDYMANEQVFKALENLVNSETAKQAWRDLLAKSSLELVLDVARSLGRRTINAYLDGADMKTAKEIKAASKKAEKLARELRGLMLNNSTLRFEGENLMSDYQRIALWRIRRGLISTATNPNYLSFFPHDIERQLDNDYAQSPDENENISTSDAYKVLAGMLNEGDSWFIDALENFEALAKNSASYPPVLPRPNKELANVNQYSVSLGYLFLEHYNSPCHEVVANFCSAVFERTIDTEIVKKWWQRKRDE